MAILNSDDDWNDLVESVGDAISSFSNLVGHVTSQNTGVVDRDTFGRSGLIFYDTIKTQSNWNVFTDTVVNDTKTLVTALNAALQDPDNVTTDGICEYASQCRQLASEYLVEITQWRLKNSM